MKLEGSLLKMVHIRILRRQEVPKKSMGLHTGLKLTMSSSALLDCGQNAPRLANIEPQVEIKFYCYSLKIIFISTNHTTLSKELTLSRHGKLELNLFSTLGIKMSHFENYTCHVTIIFS